MESQPYVPYQAYKSKRHSRHSSNPHLVPNVSPPPQSRPPTIYGNGHVASEPIVPQHRGYDGDSEKQLHLSVSPTPSHRLLDVTPRPISVVPSVTPYDSLASTATITPAPVTEEVNSSPEETSSSTKASSDKNDSPSPSHIPLPSSPVTSEPSYPTTARVIVDTSESPAESSTAASSPGPSPKLAATTRRISTFRRVPLRNSNNQRPSLPSSPLRPTGNTHTRTSSTPSRQFDPSMHRQQTESSSQVTSATSTPLLAPTVNGAQVDKPLPVLDLPSRVVSPTPIRSNSNTPGPTLSIVPPPRSSSLHPSAPSSPQTISQSPTQGPNPAGTPMSMPSPALSSASLPTTTSSTLRQQTLRSSSQFAPYRPGFQPRGVCWDLTDEFLEARKQNKDQGRVERTRLERRLEKLINLHFPHPDEVKRKSLAGGGLREKGGDVTGNANGRQMQNRRASSFFDLTFADLKSKSAGELWKEMITQPPTPGSKNDIRAAEQNITPWEDDAAVSQCPLCTASFHPLTNRKHHCRLCGRIICSLPIKNPQRPQTCSLLFVADPITGHIEEVGEGVDYGVRRRTASTQGKGKGRDVLSDDEKFLKGVRICRDCRPVLLRRQYIEEIHHVPIFSKLYDAFIMLEKEIEDALPQFSELILSLSTTNEERPPAEVSAARKRLVDAFAQYDALAKRIRRLPCPSGPGSSQDRVQMAILTRANIFLQKNMFPLQALPKPQKPTTSKPTTPEAGNGPLIDPDSDVAHALQPLLEQEALLETFVDEAKAHRKFEDAKTLKANLAEIRAEIDRILVNADTSRGRAGRGGS